MKTFGLTNVARYVKRHFAHRMMWKNLTYIEGLKKAFYLDFGHNEFDVKDMARILTSHVSCLNTREFDLEVLLPQLAPKETWKVGYRHNQGYGWIEKPDDLQDYDYHLAIIYTLCSGISLTEVAHFPKNIQEKLSKTFNR